MSRYAQGTKTSVSASLDEIQRLVTRFGADAFAFGRNDQGAMIGFRLAGRHIRFDIALPPPGDKRFSREKANRSKTPKQAQEAWEAELRRLFRVLVECVRGKLVAVEEGLATAEQEFLAYTLLPDGSTVGEAVAPRLAEAYETGKMPSLLPALPAGRET